MVCVHHKICTDFKMTNISDVQTPREIEGVSVATSSNITDSSSNMTVGIPTTIEDKKRRIDAVYASDSWMDEDPYEILKMRQVVIYHVFKNLKFVKGEGQTSLTTNSEKKNAKVIW